MQFLSPRNCSTPFIRFPYKFRFTSYAQFPKASTLARQFYERSMILSRTSPLSGLIFSIPFLLRLSTIKLLQSASAYMLPRPWPGSVTVNITSGENLLVNVLSMGMVILPPRSYFSRLNWERSLNFYMLMSLRLAPNSLEDMLLSFT